MTDYSKLSDFEINSLVSAHLWGSVCAVDGIVLHNEKDGEFNPCKNPSDAWPIIVDKRITLDADVDIWFARDDTFVHTDKNPLRAAMIVFLMMQDASHG